MICPVPKISYYIFIHGHTRIHNMHTHIYGCIFGGVCAQCPRFVVVLFVSKKREREKSKEKKIMRENKVQPNQNWRGQTKKKVGIPTVPERRIWPVNSHEKMSILLGTLSHRRKPNFFLHYSVVYITSFEVDLCCHSSFLFWGKDKKNRRWKIMKRGPKGRK